MAIEPGGQFDDEFNDIIKRNYTQRQIDDAEIEASQGALEDKGSPGAHLTGAFAHTTNFLDRFKNHYNAIINNPGAVNAVHIGKFANELRTIGPLTSSHVDKFRQQIELAAIHHVNGNFDKAYKTFSNGVKTIESLHQQISDILGPSHPITKFSNEHVAGVQQKLADYDDHINRMLGDE